MRGSWCEQGAANGGNGSAARTRRSTAGQRLVAQSCRVRALPVAVTGKLRKTAAEARTQGYGINWERNRKSMKSKQPLPSAYSITRGSRRVH